MSTLGQTSWTNKFTRDEVFPSGIKSLCDLINAMFVKNVYNEVAKRRKEKCCWCMVDYPSQKSHHCLMMTKERAFGRDSLWKELNEAIPVMKLSCHGQVMEHYETLKNVHEATLNILMRLSDGGTHSEYTIINYISCSTLEHCCMILLLIRNF